MAKAAFRNLTIFLVTAILCGCMNGKVAIKPEYAENRKSDSHPLHPTSTYLSPRKDAPDSRVEMSIFPHKIKMTKLGTYLNGCSMVHSDKNLVIWSSTSGVYDTTTTWGVFATDWNGNVLWERKIVASPRVLCDHLLGIECYEDRWQACDLQTGKTIFEIMENDNTPIKLVDGYLTCEAGKEDFIYRCKRCKSGDVIFEVRKSDGYLLPHYVYEENTYFDKNKLSSESAADKPYSIGLEGSEEQSKTLKIKCFAKDEQIWERIIKKEDLPLLRHIRSNENSSVVNGVFYLYDKTVLFEYNVPDFEWAYISLIAFDLETGKTKWISELPPAWKHLYHKGILFVQHYDYDYKPERNWLNAIDIETGKVLATKEINTFFTYSMLKLIGDRIYFTWTGKPPNPTVEPDPKDFENSYWFDNYGKYNTYSYGKTTTDWFCIELE